MRIPGVFARYRVTGGPRVESPQNRPGEVAVTHHVHPAIDSPQREARPGPSAIERDVSDLVKLRITDSSEPGREVELVMRRARAEAIIGAGLGREYWPRFEFEVGPCEVPMSKLRAALKALVGKSRPIVKTAAVFVLNHKSEIAAAAAWLVSLPLPAPYHQLATLLSAALAGLAGTKYGS